MFASKLILSPAAIADYKHSKKQPVFSTLGTGTVFFQARVAGWGSRVEDIFRENQDCLEAGLPKVVVYIDPHLLGIALGDRLIN
jgi:hypothetical protein